MAHRCSALWRSGVLRTTRNYAPQRALYIPLTQNSTFFTAIKTLRACSTNAENKMLVFVPHTLRTNVQGMLQVPNPIGYKGIVIAKRRADAPATDEPIIYAYARIAHRRRPVVATEVLLGLAEDKDRMTRCPNAAIIRDDIVYCFVRLGDWCISECNICRSRDLERSTGFGEEAVCFAE